MKIKIVGLSLFISALLFSCAQPRPVTGGPKDETPPKILASVPANFSTQFSGNSLYFEFDEYIQVRNLSGEVVVSPPLRYPLEYKLKGKKLYFTIRDTLSEETTYNFNFGNAIVDNNEGNPLDSNLFVFSTGTSLDSGSISGTVKDAYTMKPMKNVTIAVFSSTDDSAVYRGNPIYISKTDNAGNFELNYLSAREYVVYALENPGPDYSYVPLTKVGFYPFTVFPVEADTINLYLFEEQDTSQYVSKEYSSDYFTFTLGFHRDLISPKFTLQPDSIEYILQEIAADSFNFWIRGDVDVDSVTVIVEDLEYLDTVKVDVDSREQFYKKLKREKKETSPVKVSANTKSGVFHYFDTLKLNFSRPITHWDAEKIWFINGTDTLSVDSLMKLNVLDFSISDSSFVRGVNLTSSPVAWDWKPSTNYGFVLYPGALTDIIHQTNDTTILTFKTQSFEDYGSFRFTIKVPEYDGPLRLEFLDAQGHFLRAYSIKSGDVIYHPLVVPDKYTCRLIIDENGNNTWDTGDLKKKILPEYIMYYDGVIEIKPNWDMEETWVVNLK